MTVSTVAMLAPFDNFPTFELRPGVDVAWTGGVGPFNVRYEWDDNVGFTSPITVLNTSVTSPDSAVPTSDMGPIGTDWYCRVTVIDTDDSGEVQDPVTHNTITFEDVDLQNRYLYLNHNVGVGFGYDDFDDLVLGDGDPDLFSRFLYLNANVDNTVPVPWIRIIEPSLLSQGDTLVIKGQGFDNVARDWSAAARLYDSSDLSGSYTALTEISFDPDVGGEEVLAVTVPAGAASGWVVVVNDDGL